MKPNIAEIADTIAEMEVQLNADQCFSVTTRQHLIAEKILDRHWPDDPPIDRWAALMRLANRTYRCELIGDFAGWEINAIDELGAEYKLGSGLTLDAAIDDAVAKDAGGA